MLFFYLLPIFFCAIIPVVKFCFCQLIHIIYRERGREVRSGSHVFRYKKTKTISLQAMATLVFCSKGIGEVSIFFLCSYKFSRFVAGAITKPNIFKDSIFFFQIQISCSCHDKIIIIKILMFINKKVGI